MAILDATDQFLSIDRESFTAPMADALLRFSVNEEVKQRAEELAEKANFGTITAEEHAEYLRLVELAELMSLLQAKARRFLADHV